MGYTKKKKASSNSSPKQKTRKSLTSSNILDPEKTQSKADVGKTDTKPKHQIEPINITPSDSSIESIQNVLENEPDNPTNDNTTLDIQKISSSENKTIFQQNNYQRREKLSKPILAYYSLADSCLIPNEYICCNVQQTRDQITMKNSKLYWKCQACKKKKDAFHGTIFKSEIPVEKIINIIRLLAWNVGIKQISEEIGSSEPSVRKIFDYIIDSAIEQEKRENDDKKSKESIVTSFPLSSSKTLFINYDLETKVIGYKLSSKGNDTDFDKLLEEGCETNAKIYVYEKERENITRSIKKNNELEIISLDGKSLDKETKQKRLELIRKLDVIRKSLHDKLNMPAFTRKIKFYILHANHGSKDIIDFIYEILKKDCENRNKDEED